MRKIFFFVIKILSKNWKKKDCLEQVLILIRR